MQNVPTGATGEAVSAHADPFLFKLEAYVRDRMAIEASETTDEDAFTAERNAIHDRFFGNMPPITTMPAALAALRRGLVEEGSFGDTRAEALFRAVEGFLENRVSRMSAPHADPALALVNEYRTQYAAFLASPEYHAQNGTVGGDREAIDKAAEALTARTWGPSHKLIAAGGFEASTSEGAAACIELVLSEDIEGGLGSFGRPLLAAAHGFLNADNAPDPLVSLIEEYRKQNTLWRATEAERNDDEDAAYQAAHVMPLFEKLRDDCPPATTLAGAIAAFQLVADENAWLANWNAASSVLAAGHAYFEGRASA